MDDTIFARPAVAARQLGSVVAAPADGSVKAQPAPPPGRARAAPAQGFASPFDQTRPAPAAPPPAQSPAASGTRGADARAAPRKGPPAGTERSDALYAAFDVYRDNPSLGLAAPIFDLLASVEATTQTPDIEWLHQTLVQGLQDFEAQATANGLNSQQVRITLYALAATVDDGVLKTNWGKDSFWSSKSMISMFFRETWGGERFFALLNQMMAAPQPVLKEIEFFYYCLEFGFEGKYRLAANGAGELAHLCEEIFQILRSAQGPVKTDLSPKWRGVSVEQNQLRDLLPIWIGGAVLGTLLVAAFVALAAVLRHDSSLAVEKVSALLAAPAPHVAKPPIPVAAPPAQPAPAPAPAAPPKPAVPAPDPYQIISTFLGPEQKAGVLQVMKQDNKVVIRTVGEVFATASTGIRAQFTDVIKHIGQALMKTPGSIEVIGYSDNVPINTATYPNNQVLSQARAGRVADFLAAEMGSPARLSATGRGSSDPIASNATPEGRQANRRVEIVLTPQ
ncbi:type IVB secretion system protein IcmH/DotU [Roseixanthobacter pseudopolyaromaticivorans]|uniref:type IVB secretion system protein IcmH/DotU n=1 Tax=Xanthobacteraceae TaxID=335928 RepID=UPI00372C8F17